MAQTGMIEEPYRWLEAISNRREYVRDQLKGGMPAAAASLPEGILLVSIGTGDSKIFEIFDRQAIAAVGHPADIEKLRQASIDQTHIEAFTRAAEDVSLRRLVGFFLSSQIKTAFEQIFAAPFLAELLFCEVAETAAHDSFYRLHFDGSFEQLSSRVAYVAADGVVEKAATDWARNEIGQGKSVEEMAEILLQGCWLASAGHLSGGSIPDIEARRSGWRTALAGRKVEAALLDRSIQRPAKYRVLTLDL
jgi:proteasome alpha subunit